MVNQIPVFLDSQIRFRGISQRPPSKGQPTIIYGLTSKWSLSFLARHRLCFALRLQARLVWPWDGEHGGRHWKATQYRIWHTHITCWNHRRLEITKSLYMPTHGEIVDRMVPEIHPIQFKVIYFISYKYCYPKPMHGQAWVNILYLGQAWINVLYLDTT